MISPTATVAPALQNLAQRAAFRRGQVDRGLLGVNDDHRLVLLHRVAFRLQPLSDLHFSDGFADFGILVRWA
jgi:hypothetical protein